mgnify:CR=1 FL=1
MSDIVLTLGAPVMEPHGKRASKISVRVVSLSLIHISEPTRPY